MRSLLRLLGLMKPYRKSVGLGWLSMVCLVAADLAIPRVLQTTIDQGIARRASGVILQSALIMVALILVSAAATVAVTVLSVRVSQSVAADLRRDLFARVLSLSFANLDHWQTGQLMTRLSSDNAQIAQFIFMSMRMFLRAPLMIVGSLILMVLTNWQLALIMLFLMPATILVFVLYADKAQPLFMQVQRQLDRLNSIFQENLAGVRVVKAFARGQHENRRFDATNIDLMEHNIRVGRFLAMLLPVLRYLVNLGIVAVIALGGALAVRGALSVGQIIAFNSYLLWVMMALTNLGMMVGFISASDASAQRIFAVLDENPQVTESPAAIPLPCGEGRLALENVTFSYGSEEQEAVLKAITLEKLTAFLHAFYARNYLHRIQQISITPGNDGKSMDLMLSVDAVVLEDAASKDALPEGEPARRELPPLKDYVSVIAGRNLFAVYQPPPPPRPPRTPEPPRQSPPPPPPALDPSRFAYVNAIVEVNGKREVWLYSRTEGKTLRLNENDPFAIGVVKGRVVRIGVRDVEIEVDGEPRKLSLGDCLYSESRQPDKET